MLFNSIDFILFFLVFTLFYFLSKPKYRWLLLLAASYFFYMYWKWEYIFLIILSTTIDYYCAFKMSEKSNKKDRYPYLIVSIVSNLGLLFTFKYLDFFLLSTNQVLSTSFPMFNLILPMGISFYTFQTLSYSVDVYQGKIKSEKHFGKFALYVSFFPQLVAGPIERATSLLPQLQENKNKLTYDNIVLGLTQVLLGFFKKVVIADTVAMYVNSIYGNHELHTGFTLLFATYLFAIQIYCDFSGYSDIAIGCSRILGYNLMENFKQPYASKSVTEFWRRWHISLSTWLRDYLYFPLGGNRRGKLFTYRNLLIVMLLGGLWHGASWNFVIWGALNGIFLALEKLTGYHHTIANKSGFIQLLSKIVTFHLICLTWIFFRAETLDKAISIVSKIFSPDYFFNLKIIDTNVFASIAITTSFFIFLELFVLNKLSFKNLEKGSRTIAMLSLKLVLCLFIILFGISEGSQFIYFQF